MYSFTQKKSITKKKNWVKNRQLNISYVILFPGLDIPRKKMHIFFAVPDIVYDPFLQKITTFSYLVYKFWRRVQPKL